jgi:hypothetical protein
MEVCLQPGKVALAAAIAAQLSLVLLRQLVQQQQQQHTLSKVPA